MADEEQSLTAVERFNLGLEAGIGAFTGQVESLLQVGGLVVAASDWFNSAIALLGDIVDPFLPGFSGSELRPTSSKVTLAQINQQRRAAGLTPIGGRRRRKRALTKSDREDIAFIAGMISKAAAGNFAMIVAGRT